MVGGSGASFTCDFAWVSFSVLISHTALSPALTHFLSSSSPELSFPRHFLPSSMLFLRHDAFLGNPINSDLCIPYELVNLVWQLITAESLVSAASFYYDNYRIIS